ncbi:LysR family transcriptional regulator [bacterium]|nr:LysR family transcriptional regulator [bacterium]
MKRVLPSMTALQAFDAAARAGSFTAAAHELNLTQGAVSKQIIALEDLLGVPLFERQGHAVALTEAGRGYAKEVRRALEIVMAASLRVLTNPDGGTLELAVLPTFGTRWLMPRLGDFLTRHPRIQVNVTTKLAPFDFRLAGLHAAIHYGKPNWPHAECTYLMGEHVAPVCSPGFKARHDVNEPADLLDLPLLHISSRPGAWEAWFAGQGIACEEPGGMAFEQFLTAAQAAVADIGVALLPRFLVDYEINRGELVVAVDRPFRSAMGYYLAVPRDRAHAVPVVAFRQWLLDTIAADRGEAEDATPDD